ncbi:uncharacterized protein (TIGR00730 family) [Parabacteroides sp. PF5-5]|uniref:LOG family protein n=1 Tax=unclassified Parabacteroides TaxID=2649774 RepID=UPI0024730DD6|nr:MULTISPECIES: TIGR00730 family Rossman fold protein [unclassified Parabacteroides]MDH6304472.1 uncharacterized protein (TIGR00730 family) [Parabacteroides sp. PH5-39]MDH6315375.1 uncharacterized protein (TIGR00730 family) [Parabacteroides sp. PF5-13]MDH6319131.1 uncharacterized protein (TIGR00730 family) [Parabacteroides sp. PH5-13]MDH6322861.1 uncharacterized protein (TIGR00730 family) [Parabacteroides sp. PH5-8]MDH6326567.1 uncharacterized protein (TIGR00730 family) [Parabacteroides sp. P
MHERKYRMNEWCDGVIVLPGGYGTMDEFFEMITWGQLGLHKKPIVLFNINGFYDPVIQQTQIMTAEGFLQEAYRDILIVGDTIPNMLEQMRNYQPPSVGKWILKSDHPLSRR